MIRRQTERQDIKKNPPCLPVLDFEKGGVSLLTIRDKVALGAVAGILGSIPPLALNLVLTTAGISKYYSFQISAGAFLEKQLTGTPGGLILGGMAWELSSAILGILIVYVIYFTGKEYWWLKGILTATAFMYVLLFGFIFDICTEHLTPKDLGSNASLLCENILFGVTSSFLAIRVGKEELD